MAEGHRNRSSNNGWTRNLSNTRSFLGNVMGGLRGFSNVVSWGFAGTLAYFICVKPSQDLKRQQQERIVAAAQSTASSDLQSQSQPHETGLVVQGDSNTKPRNP